MLLASGLYAADPGSAPVVKSVVRADVRSGKLVRSVIVTPKSVSRQTVTANVVTPRVVEPVEVTAAPPAAPAAATPSASDGLNAVVESIAAQNSLNPQLIHSVIKVESNYNPNAVSPKGALGLMQLIPATARRFGVTDVFDPVENIQGGARYLKYLLDLYNNDISLALAAYNAGEGAVAKYGNVPPYAETRNYLLLVAKHFQESQKAAEAAAAQRKQQQAKAAAPNPDAPRQIQQVNEADGTVRYVVR